MNASLGPLFGLHVFMDRFGARIIDSKTDSAQIVWKCFNDRSWGGDLCMFELFFCCSFSYLL